MPSCFRFRFVCSPSRVRGLLLATAGMAVAQGLMFSTTAVAHECSQSGGTAPSGTGSNSIACGSEATAAGGQSTAYGYSSESSEIFSTAIGSVTRANGYGALAVGSYTIAGGYATALGAGADATAISSTAVGYGANALNHSTLALGRTASASADYSIAVGANSVAAAEQTIVIGRSASGSGAWSTVVGALAESGYNGTVVLGQEAEALANDVTVVGRFASGGGASATAAGYAASANGGYSSAFGNLAQSAGYVSTALGYNSIADGDNAVALGRTSNALAPDSIAIGRYAETEQAASNSIALGYYALATQPNTFVIGDPANASLMLDVGIGTAEPLAPLHIRRTVDQAGVLVEQDSAVVAPRTLFTLANPGNTKFEIMNTDAMESWAFTNSGTDFRVSLQDSGVIEFRVDNDGNAYVANNLEVGGTLTELSDRNRKHAIVPVDGETVLAKVAQLPVSEWSYDSESADQRHIGPMAQDFHAAFGLASGETRISARDMAGVNMAAIQALVEEVQVLRKENSWLAEKVRSMESRLSSIETNGDAATVVHATYDQL